MKFLCGSCRTKYQIADDKVRGKVLTIRCKKCGAKVVVREALARDSSVAVAPLVGDEPAARAEAANAPSAASRQIAQAFDAAMHGALDDMPTSIAPTPSNEADAGVEWYVAIDGQQSGPFAYAELVSKLRRREVAGRHYVWHDGFENWKRVRDIPDLAKYVPVELKVDPKKRPPPPPETQVDTGAEVLDLAAKRAEREKKTREPSLGVRRDEPSIPAEEVRPSKVLDAAPSSLPAPAPAEVLGTADLQPLKEALESPVATARLISTPGAVPLTASGGASLASGGAHTSRETSADAFIPEDIFDKVPRASAEEVVSRESTRFFVAAAGVNKQSSRNKVGIFAAVGAGIAVLAFLGLWASGAISIALPGLGNPFATRTAPEEDTAVISGELSEDDRTLLAGLKGEAKAEKLREIRARKPKPTGAPSAKPQLAYVDDKAKDGEPAAPRGGGDVPVKATIDRELDRMGGSANAGSVGGNAPSEARTPDMPELETGTLDADAIRRVISDNRQAVSFCYQRERMRNSELKGRVDFTVTVEPAGNVSSVGTDTPAFKGSTLATCISDKIKDWRFPAFKGAAKQVHVPFVLQP
jgi:predicted Zn finger-like uncharacterized protein